MYTPKEQRLLDRIAALKEEGHKKNQKEINKLTRSFSRSFYKDHPLFSAQGNHDADLSETMSLSN